MLLTFAVLPLAASTLLLAAPRQPRSVQHVDVYKVAGRYGGWPANHGIWRWNNEILVGFEAGYFKDNKGGHSIDYTRPAEHLLARTTDGGRTWTRLGYVHDEPADNDYGIMPSTVRLSPTSLITSVRFRRWIEAYRSDDNGTTWQHLARAVPDTGRGNPPSLVKLADGRLVITYGYRAEPYGIRARVSKDEGRTWDDEIELRNDGGTWDLGYTRTVQRPDGKLVTVYYYNVGDAERFIGATIWEP